MNVEEFSDELAKELKNLGYKKNRLTWSKSNGEATVVFAIQKSAYGPDTWYYCFGIRINKLCNTKSISISQCHIQERLNHIQNGYLGRSDDIVSLLCKWERLYGDLRELRIRAIEGKLPRQVSSNALTFLTFVDISKL